MESASALVAAYLGNDHKNPSKDCIHIPYWAKKKVQGAHLDTFYESTHVRTANVNNCVLKLALFAKHTSANIRLLS